MSCQHFFFPLKYNLLFSVPVVRRQEGLVPARKGVEYYHQRFISFNHFTLDLNNVAYGAAWPCSLSLPCELENGISLKPKI